MRTNKVLIQTLKQIENRDGGITPSAIVKEATKTTSPLHRYFEWDDTEAAEQWRLQQARMLINSVRIEVYGKNMGAFMNVSVKVNEMSEKSYLSTEVIITEEALFLEVARQALEQLKHWRIKYNTLIDVKRVINPKEIDSLIEQLEREVIEDGS